MKHNLLAVFGAFLAFTTTGPAHAADPTTIDCVLERLDTSTREALSAGARKEALEEKAGDYLDKASTAKYVAVSQRCEAQFGWSEKARVASVIYSLEKARVPAYEAAIREDGFDVAKVESIIRALPPATRAGLMQRLEMSDAMEALFGDLARVKIDVVTERQGFHVAALALAMSSMEAQEAEFAAS